MGGVDWNALPIIAELFGVADIELLIHRLQIIKMHKPEEKK